MGRTIAFAELFIYMVLLSFASCGQCPNEAGAKEYQQFVTQRAVNEDEAVRIFDSFSIDKQIDVFLYAENCRRDTHLLPLLARDGEKKIETIVLRIESEDLYWNKSLLVTVLVSINTRCRCITSDSDIIRRLERVEDDQDKKRSVVEDEHYREGFRQSVDFLKHQLQNYPPNS